MNQKLMLGVMLGILMILTLAEAKNIAMVVKNKNDLSEQHELRVYNTLLKAGHNIVLTDDSFTVNYTDFDLIVVAGRPGNLPLRDQLGDFAASIPVNEMPTVAIDAANPAKWGWLKIGSASTTASSQKQKIFIINNTNPITEDLNLSQEVTVHVAKDGSVIDFKQDRTPLKILASVDRTGDYGVIAVAEPNTTLFNNATTKSRIVFFGIADTLLWNDKAESLFSKSIEWAVAKESMAKEEVDAIDKKNETAAAPSQSTYQQVPGGGGSPIPDVSFTVQSLQGDVELLGLPQTFEVETGKPSVFKFQLHNGLNAGLTNVYLDIIDLSPTTWFNIIPPEFDVIGEGETKEVSIIFDIPKDAEIYTYPVTLRVITHSKFGSFPYFEKFNLLVISSADMPPVTTTTTTSTTLPPQEKPLSGLTGYFVYIASHPLLLGALLVLLGMLFIVWRYYPHPIFGRKGYVWKKGWRY